MKEVIIGEKMIRFIFSMLFYGFFLGILAIVCMWFFLGMTVQESINWLIDKTSQTQEIVSDGASAVGSTVRSVSNNVERQIERVAESL